MLLRTVFWLALSFLAASPAHAKEEAFIFESRSGQKTEAFKGSFEVLENRADPNSRTLTVHYVRFPATGDTKGAPIVYLSGGPGGSGIGTAKGERFPLFMALREFGDVIALDQRGTGQSATAPQCVSDVVIPMNRAIAPAERNAQLRRAATYCLTYWQGLGFDPAGYTTLESAHDLDALRVHLGADKITLWGISYGSHLALAAIKVMPDHIDRVILASVEGLDQTVKLPAETDAYFDRLQAAIDTDPVAKAIYPDIKSLMRRVHHKLASQPKMIVLQTPSGPQTVFLTPEIMQMMASAMIADPQGAARVLSLYLAVDADIYAPLEGLLPRLVSPGQPERFQLMPLAMDVASGIGAERLNVVETQARTALLGDILNYPMPHLAGLGQLDLGDEFRTPPHSDLPVLVLMGTLDGRTYPAEQQAAVSGLTNVTTVVVENAGHNLFMVAPEVTEVIMAFIRGETPQTTRIIAPLPPLSPEN